MRSEQIQLAKALGIAPEDLEDVDLLWHAIGQIQMLNAKLAELRKDRDRLDWIFNNSKPIIAEKNDFDCNMCTAELWFSSDGCSGTMLENRDELDNAMKEVIK